MAHIDVVPARREDWSMDPWTLLERDGWFYGRGSTDNKAGAAMLVANFVALKRAGWQPARNLIIVLTGDEETAQKGIQTLLEKHRQLLNAELAFNTDGGSVRLIDGRPAVFEVQASEKIYADYQLEVTDVGGHSSLVRPGQPDLHACGSAHTNRRAPVSAARQRRDADVPSALGGYRERPNCYRHARGRGGAARSGSGGEAVAHAVLQRAASHDVRRHDGTGRPCEQRAAAACAGGGQLPHSARACPAQMWRR